MIKHQYVTVNGSKVFYREAGPKHSPTMLLLHGFPTSSHMFRNLIPKLADRFHVVAPDLPGFGFSDAPDRKQFRYTFENLAKVIDALRVIGVQVASEPKKTAWGLRAVVRDSDGRGVELYQA